MESDTKVLRLVPHGGTIRRDVFADSVEGVQFERFVTHPRGMYVKKRTGPSKKGLCPVGGDMKVLRLVPLGGKVRRDVFADSVEGV